MSKPRKNRRDPNRSLSFPLNVDPSHPYLVERGLTPESISEFGLGYCAQGELTGRIAIPIHNAEGDLVGYAGRWPGEPPDGQPRYRRSDDLRRADDHVYRLAKALHEPPEQPLVVVQDFFDSIKLWQLGVRKCVAIMGLSLSFAQEAVFLRYLTPASRVIVMFGQGDAAQLAQEWILLRLSSRAFVRVVSFRRP